MIFQVRGMCGNMNGMADDDFTAANGIIQGQLAFASYWKHTPCTAQEPSVPVIQPCQLNGFNKDAAQNICEWVGHADIFGECAVAFNMQPFKKNCIYDMCARDDSSDNGPVCLWLAALSHECRQKGIEVTWHTRPELQSLCAGR